MLLSEVLPPHPQAIHTQLCKRLKALIPGDKADLVHTNGLSTGLNAIKEGPLFLSQSAAQLVYCTYVYNYAWCTFPISCINSSWLENWVGLGGG